MDTAPISYIHGSGRILPSLEAELTGLIAGDKKSIIVPSQQDSSQVMDEILIDVVIDEVRESTADERAVDTFRSPFNDINCGTGCDCWK